MVESYKLILLTSMVTVSESYVPGDEIEVDNDEAWQLLNEGLAKPKKKGQKMPQIPKRVAEARARAEEEAKRQVEIQLPCVHPEGEELKEALAKLAERDQQLKEQSDLIAQLESKVAALEEVLSELENSADSDGSENPSDP